MNAQSQRPHQVESAPDELPLLRALGGVQPVAIVAPAFLVRRISGQSPGSPSSSRRNAQCTRNRKDGSSGHSPEQRELHLELPGGAVFDPSERPGFRLFHCVRLRIEIAAGSPLQGMPWMLTPHGRFRPRATINETLRSGLFATPLSISDKWLPGRQRTLPTFGGQGS